MNWFGLHIGDWLKKTQLLTCVQEGAYLRLINWCYANESPLPLDRTDINRIARTQSRHDRVAVQYVLDEFFDEQADGYHNKRVDEETVRRNNVTPTPTGKLTRQRERQARYRDRRSTLFALLAAKRVYAAFNATMDELEALCVTHNVTRDVTASPVTVTPSGDASRPRLTQQPTTNNHNSADAELAVTGVTADAEPPAPATRAGQAARVMRTAGLGTVNPSDPRLLAILDAGASDDELRVAAHEASIRGKPFAWALATVAGRMRDGKELADQLASGNGAASGLERPRSASDARARALAPKLFQKRN